MNQRLIKALSIGLLGVVLATGCSAPVKETTPEVNTQKQDTQVEVVESKQAEINVDDLLIKPVFSTPEDGARALAKEDAYINVLSQFDYASKFKSEKPLDEAERFEYYSKATLEFSAEEKARITAAMARLSTKLDGLGFNVPSEVNFIKTNGIEEGGAAYTRDVNIVFPESFFNMDKDFFEQIVAHEFFHVYTRYNEQARAQIYSIIGFSDAAGLTYPDSIKDLVVSNPDAPDIRYYVTDTYKDKDTLFIPITYSSEAYDFEKNKTFFETMQLKMLAVELQGDLLVPILEDGNPILVDLYDLPNVYKNTGENTDYVIHPEEIMADNFAYFVVDKKVKSQWVIDQLVETMKSIQ